MKTRLARFAGILMTAGLMTAAAPAVTAAGPRPTPAHAHAAAGPRPTPAHAAAGCPGAAAVPTRRTVGRAARATVCLLNGQRAANGLRPLRPNRALDRSARRYAHALVANHFFSHVAPNGQTLPARISRSGYLRGARGYAYGENLAWGAGVRATPLQIVRSWLASPPHRENILNARYRNIGIGIAPGAPVRGVSHAASYVTHFGWRG